MMKKPNKNFIYTHTNGRCDAFAIALHRLTGWPIKALWSDDCEMDPESGDPILVLLHAWCERAKGMAVDARGCIAESTLVELYGDGIEDEDSVETYKTEKSFFEDLQYYYSGQVEEAQEVINQHLVFYIK